MATKRRINRGLPLPIAKGEKPGRDWGCEKNKKVFEDDDT